MAKRRRKSFSKWSLQIKIELTQMPLLLGLLLFQLMLPLFINVFSQWSTQFQQQKQRLGDRLFPLVSAIEPQLAGKITGMLLEMDNTEIFRLLATPPNHVNEVLNAKVAEAATVLRMDEPLPQAEQQHQPVKKKLNFQFFLHLLEIKKLMLLKKLEQ